MSKVNLSNGNMGRIILAATVAAALAFAGLQGEPALAQTPPAKEATDKDASKAKKAEERKAKRAEAKKARAEKKEKASAARAAVRDRQKQCGAEWREARKAGTVEKTMTWPKFWSACNTRLKAKADNGPAFQPRDPSRKTDRTPDRPRASERPVLSRRRPPSLREAGDALHDCDRAY